MTVKVLVVGGGIAGLATAVALRKAGHEVIVLEKSQAKREDGFAVSTPPNCTRVLRSWGLDFAKARMVTCAGLDMIKADISPIKIFPRSHDQVAYGAPFMCAHRIDLHEALREMATGIQAAKGPPVEIREGCNVVSYDAGSGSVSLNTGEVLQADFVVAADGVRSQAHRWILGEERPAVLSKLSSLRFVVPTERLVEHPSLAAHKFGETRMGVYFGSSNKIGLFRSPCRDNTLQNFGVFHIQNSAPDPVQQSTNGHQIERAGHSMALKLFQSEGLDSSLSDIVRLANEDEMYLWRVADRDPLPRYVHEKLVLVGDAAHPMQPNHGQGASQAIEDAGVLGLLMTGASTSDIATRLNMFERLRIARASAVQLLSRSEELDGTLAEDTIFKLRKFVPEDELPELTRPAIFHWLFSNDCLADAEKAVAGGVATNHVKEDLAWRSLITQ